MVDSKKAMTCADSVSLRLRQPESITTACEESVVGDEISSLNHLDAWVKIKL